jgi:hypothetical protein
VYPQIYLGQIPATPAQRRDLRALALDLRGRIQAARTDEPTTLLLHFAAGAGPLVDLLLLRSQVLIVAALRAYRAPIVAPPGGRWAYRDTGAPIDEPGGTTPIQHIGAQRDAVRALLSHAAPTLPGLPANEQPFEQIIGALICRPAIHPDSQIALEISEHRRRLKLLGLDELPGLAAMVRTGPPLAQPVLRAIVADVLGGRLWHDGTRFLFDLAPPRFQLRVLATGARPEKLLPLFEGENVIGRRRAAQQYEYRLTLAGDELISADHATLIVGDDDTVTVRDTSKNGTWLAAPNAAEARVRRERTVAVGAELRIGITRMRLERPDQ